jgi:hypothetical protein
MGMIGEEIQVSKSKGQMNVKVQNKNSLLFELSNRSDI